MDKVSVIVPIYNAEKFLNRCLDSICNQTYNELEIILVDDGSTDNSLKICKDYKEKDDRIILISKENTGVADNRNVGLNVATGEFILFVDADDWIENNMVERLVSNIQFSNSDISCCQYDKSSIDNIGELECWNQDETIKNFLIHKKINGSLVNKLIKKSVIKDIRFNEKIRYGEDALFLWNILLQINSISITNQILYHVTLHNDSATGGGSYKIIRKDCILVWSKIAEAAENINLEYKKIARMQLANMSFYSLYEMGYYGYKNKDDEIIFRNVLRDNYIYLKNSPYISIIEKIFAKIIIYNFMLPKLIFRVKSKACI